MSISSVASTPLKAIMYPRTNPNVVQTVEGLVAQARKAHPPLLKYTNGGNVDSLYITKEGSKVPGFAQKVVQKLQTAGVDMTKSFRIFDQSLTEEEFQNLRNTGIGKFIG